MPSRRHLLIAGVLCIAFAGAFGWFILEPFLERVFLRSEGVLQQTTADAPLKASAGNH
jgi:hypothetical protein